MKRLVVLLALTLILCTAGVGWTDYQAGLAAYNSGDYQTALNEWRLLAEQGHAMSQNYLGFLHEKGLGVKQNYEGALKWYRKAAEQGLQDAQNNLGSLYDRGQGVTQNYEEALKWYRKAVEQGVGIAHINLGFMYEKGHGVIQNHEVALKWYRKAAEQGYALSQFKLGTDFATGSIVKQDVVKALKWLILARDQGDMNASKWVENISKQIPLEQVVLASQLAMEWSPTTRAQSDSLQLQDNDIILHNLLVDLKRTGIANISKPQPGTFIGTPNQYTSNLKIVNTGQSVSFDVSFKGSIVERMVRLTILFLSEGLQISKQEQQIIQDGLEARYQAIIGESLQGSNGLWGNIGEFEIGGIEEDTGGIDWLRLKILKNGTLGVVRLELKDMNSHPSISNSSWNLTAGLYRKY